MKETKIRQLPDDIWADVQRIAGEAGTSANSIMLEAVTGYVAAWRAGEKKRITKRLDELNQGRLV